MRALRAALLLWILVHLRDPTCIVQLSHVSANRPLPDATPCRAHSTMPHRRGNGPEHVRVRRWAQEATVWSLLADAVTKAHAAALHDPADSARTFLGETALPAVRALNGAGAPVLLRAMRGIVNAVRPGLIGPEAALYGYRMKWRTCDWFGQPLSMADTLRLTGGGSATSLHSSALALLHPLGTRCPMDAAP